MGNLRRHTSRTVLCVPAAIRVHSWTLAVASSFLARTFICVFPFDVYIRFLVLCPLRLFLRQFSAYTSIFALFEL